MSKIRLWSYTGRGTSTSLLSNLELRFSNLGFKTWVFNSQFLTQTDIAFYRFPNFKPEKGHFLVYFNRPTMVKYVYLLVWRKSVLLIDFAQHKNFKSNTDHLLQLQWNSTAVYSTDNMVLLVVEFLREGYKIRKVFG